MSLPQIGFDEGEALLDWGALTEALAEGHSRPKAEVGDTFLYRGKDTLLSRSGFGYSPLTRRGELVRSVHSNGRQDPWL